MAKLKAWSVDEGANRIVVEWPDGRKGSFPATDIHLAAFIKTYMDIIPQATIREHLDILCK